MAKRVVKGERLIKIDGDSWNEFCDTTDRVKALPSPDARPGAGKPSLKGLVIQCQNTTGADLEAEFPIVRLTDPPITPADYANIVRQGIVLKGDTPDDTNAFWGVMQGPCPNGSQRPIVFRGLTWATVNISKSAHTTCGPSSGDSTKLYSGLSGAKIAWRPAGTGDQVCLVEIGDSVADWVIATLDADMTGGSPTLATVNFHGGAPEHSADPGNPSNQVHLQSSVGDSHPSSTQLFGLLADGTSNPRVYEALKVPSGGSGGDPSLPDVDCTMQYTEDVLGVNLPAVAGFGLAVGDSSLVCNEEGTGGGYCCLYVDITCGLKRFGNKVGVDIEAIAGRGLVASTESSECSTYAEEGFGGLWCCINVDIACGLKWVGENGDQIGVDRLAIIGCGLKEGDGECDIDVDNETLAGPGLVPVGECALAVAYDPTYFIFDEVNNYITLLNPPCNAIKSIACSGEIVGGKLTITITPTMCDDTTGDDCTIEVNVSEGCVS